jgi:hypothetical protein
VFNRKKIFLIVLGVIITTLFINVEKRALLYNGWKTYTNDYYDFKLEIPKDWNVEEPIIQGNNGKHRSYRLSSPNGEMVIENTTTIKNNHIKQQLPNTKVQLGQYTVDRYPYINDNNQRIDDISLINIKRQETIIFYFTISGDYEKNNELLLKILKTFAFTGQRPSLDDEINYTIPQGWKKEDTDVSLYLSFVSSDFYEEGLPTIVSGARITVGKDKRDATKTLVQQVASSYQEMWNVKTKNVTFNGIQYTNVFFTGGEYGLGVDYYLSERNGEVWVVTMTCNKNCNTKAGIDNTIYAKDRDTLLNSIKFR